MIQFVGAILFSLILFVGPNLSWAEGDEILYQNHAEHPTLVLSFSRQTGTVKLHLKSSRPFSDPVTHQWSWYDQNQTTMMAEALSLLESEAQWAASLEPVREILSSDQFNSGEQCQRLTVRLNNPLAESGLGDFWVRLQESSEVFRAPTSEQGDYLLGEFEAPLGSERRVRLSIQLDEQGKLSSVGLESLRGDFLDHRLHRQGELLSLFAPDGQLLFAIRPYSGREGVVTVEVMQPLNQEGLLGDLLHTPLSLVNYEGTWIADTTANSQGVDREALKEHCERRLESLSIAQRGSGLAIDCQREYRLQQGFTGYEQERTRFRSCLAEKGLMTSIEVAHTEFWTFQHSNLSQPEEQQALIQCQYQARAAQSRETLTLALEQSYPGLTSFVASSGVASRLWSRLEREVAEQCLGQGHQPTSLSCLERLDDSLRRELQQAPMPTLSSSFFRELPGFESRNQERFSAQEETWQNTYSTCLEQVNRQGELDDFLEEVDHCRDQVEQLAIAEFRFSGLAQKAQEIGLADLSEDLLRAELVSGGEDHEILARLLAQYHQRQWDRDFGEQSLVGAMFPRAELASARLEAMMRLSEAWHIDLDEHRGEAYQLLLERKLPGQSHLNRLKEIHQQNGAARLNGLFLAAGVTGDARDCFEGRSPRECEQQGFRELGVHGIRAEFEELVGQRYPIASPQARRLLGPIHDSYVCMGQRDMTHEHFELCRLFALHDVLRHMMEERPSAIACLEEKLGGWSHSALTKSLNGEVSEVELSRAREVFERLREQGRPYPDLRQCLDEWNQSISRDLRARLLQVNPGLWDNQLEGQGAEFDRVIGSLIDQELVDLVVEMQRQHERHRLELSLNPLEAVVAPALTLEAIENSAQMITTALGRGFVFDSNRLRMEVSLFREELKGALRWVNESETALRVQDLIPFFQESQLADHLALAELSEQVYLSFQTYLNNQEQQELRQARTQREREAIENTYNELRALVREMTRAYDFRRIINPHNRQGRELLAQVKTHVLLPRLLGRESSAATHDQIQRRLADLVLADRTPGGFAERFVATVAQRELDRQRQDSWAISRLLFYDEEDFDWDSLRARPNGQAALEYYARMVLLPEMLGRRLTTYEQGLRMREFRRYLADAQSE